VHEKYHDVRVGPAGEAVRQFRDAVPLQFRDGEGEMLLPLMSTVGHFSVPTLHVPDVRVANVSRDPSAAHAAAVAELHGLREMVFEGLSPHPHARAVVATLQIGVGKEDRSFNRTHDKPHCAPKSTIEDCREP